MLKHLVTFFSVYHSLWGDKRTPASTKFLPLAALAYLIFPIDLVPDIMPILGQMDDIGIIVLFIWIAMRAIPPSLYKEYMQPKTSSKHSKYKDVIDVTPTE